MTADFDGAPPGTGFDSVLVLLDRAMARDPSGVALQHAGRTMTYGELGAVVDRVAAGLADLGIEPCSSIAVVMDTGIDYIVVILAILRAGHAYIPLAPAIPARRISRILHLSGCTHVVVDDSGREPCMSLSSPSTMLDLASLSRSKPDRPIPHTAPTSAQTACILFTSGSTGEPKGVRTLHGNLAYYADWSQRFFAEAAGSRVPLTAAPHYAAATSQIFACLCAGATLHILVGALASATRLLDFYEAHPGFALHCVPTVWRTLLDHLEQGSGTCPAVLFLSGEALPPELLERTFAFAPSLVVWNLYGPTECVANISAGRLRPGQAIDIGEPLPGSHLFVVDESGREVADGGEGRLLISGPGVCPGYLGENMRGHRAFFEFETAAGQRLAVYDTGDLACRQGGAIQLRGRRDGQIKLRGVRIETGDVESNLLQHEEVGQAAVMLGNAPGPCLVAFVEARQGCNVDIADLRRHMQIRLPESMLPERWLTGPLPRLANGKIDRAALRARLDDSVKPAEPARGGESSAAELALATIFDHVLGTRGAGSGDDFFALGGDSLKAHALLARIEERWGVELTFGAIYADPTVAGIARLLPLRERARQAGQAASPHEGRMSQAQRGLWLMQQAHPESTAYNLCYRLDLGIHVDSAALNEGLAKLRRRHPLLGCCVVVRNGEPFLQAVPEATVNFEEIDLQNEPSASQADLVKTSLRAFARRHLARDGEPLHAWLLLRLSPQSSVLAICVHHLVFDGVSASLLLRDLFDLIAGAQRPEPIGRYADFVAREADYVGSTRWHDDRSFWSGRFEGLVAQPAFPVKYQAPGDHFFAGSRRSVVLDPGVRDSLISIARREDCSLHVLMLTAFVAVLDRHEAGAEFLIASPFANRRRIDEQAVVGYFTAVLFYRLRWAPEMSLRQLAVRIREDTIALLDHQRLPFPQLAALLRERLGVLPPGVFRLMFGYHDVSAWRSGKDMAARECFGGDSKCDLHLECFDDGNAFELVLTSRNAAIDPLAAKEWFDTYCEVIGDLGSWLERRSGEWPPPSGAALARILHQASGPREPSMSMKSIPALLESAFALHAHRAAMWFEGGELSYAELAARTQALVRGLAECAQSIRAPVAICMPHQPALLVAILACACRGIPYVPLDPAFPARRIAAIIEQAGVGLILAASGTPLDSLPRNVPQLDVERAVALNRQDNDLPRLPVAASLSPADLLYVIFTSGSTGNPKGVMVPQRGVANYLQWMHRQFGIGTDSRVLARTSISFDISTWELLLPLLAGGCVVLADRVATESPEQLGRVIADSGSTILQFVPSALRMFVEAGMLARVPCVRRIFCGGEALPRALVEDVFDSGYGGTLHNLYGPTEASIFMSWHDCVRDSPYAFVPIGRPIPNSTMFVLDGRMRLLPANVAGDLYIGGDVLADGYHGDERRTSEAFLDAPPELTEGRLYRTGDKGRLLADGSFEYLGRNDQQVKIRGYRVELQEVEHHLQTHPQVREAVAFTRQWAQDDLRLHAVFIGRGNNAPDSGELAAWLRQRLPTWMVPSTMLRVEVVPRLANGKTDYHRLRALTEVETPPARVSTAGAISDGIERTLVEIWREVLGHAGFDQRASFFEAGGHSILFLRVRELLRERLGVEFTIAELYGAPNIRELARTLREKSGAAEVAPLVAQIRQRVARRLSHLRIDRD